MSNWEQGGWDWLARERSYRPKDAPAAALAAMLKRLGLTPRRTIRVVGWTNEENGSRGGNAYRELAQEIISLDKASNVQFQNPNVK